MNQPITSSYVAHHAYRMHTKSGNCYLLENGQFYLAVQVIEKGRLSWKKYRKLPHMTLNRTFMNQLMSCYNKEGELLLYRKKGGTKLHHGTPKKVS